MDYKKINLLAIEYKTNKRIIRDILEHYKPLICLYCKGVPSSEREEVRSIFTAQLIDALEAFCPKRASFNTYAFSFLRATLRIYHSQNTFFKNTREKTALSDEMTQMDINCLVALDLDIPKILTPQERLLYRAYCIGTINWTPKLEPVLDKLIGYVRGDDS